MNTPRSQSHTLGVSYLIHFHWKNKGSHLVFCYISVMMHHYECAQDAFLNMQLDAATASYRQIYMLKCELNFCERRWVSLTQAISKYESQLSSSLSLVSMKKGKKLRKKHLKNEAKISSRNQLSARWWDLLLNKRELKSFSFEFPTKSHYFVRKIFKYFH